MLYLLLFVFMNVAHTPRHECDRIALSAVKLSNQKKNLWIHYFIEKFNSSFVFNLVDEICFKCAGFGI